MIIRSLMPGLVLLLSGCSSLSHFSWSNLSPFSWFGGSLTVSAEGLGDINASTVVTQQVLEDALGSHYHVRGGMGTVNGQVLPIYEALRDDKVSLLITGQPSGHVAQIDVMDQEISSEWGVSIGMPFSDIYQEARGACHLNTGEVNQNVECVAPQSLQVSYVFQGNWLGNPELIPSDDVLKNWTVMRIIWRVPSPL